MYVCMNASVYHYIVNCINCVYCCIEKLPVSRFPNREYLFACLYNDIVQNERFLLTLIAYLFASQHKPLLAIVEKAKEHCACMLSPLATKHSNAIEINMLEAKTENVHQTIPPKQIISLLISNLRHTGEIIKQTVSTDTMNVHALIASPINQRFHYLNSH